MHPVLTLDCQADDSYNNNSGKDTAQLRERELHLVPCSVGKHPLFLLKQIFHKFESIIEDI